MSDTETSVAIGVDIGGTKIIAGCVTHDGCILQTQQIATPSTPTAIVDVVGALCLDLQESFPTVIGIGIGTAGMVDTVTGQVVYANENLPDWTGTDFANLQRMPDVPIVAENDVRAMAYAEMTLGAGMTYDSVLCVTVGTGIGGALILNGNIWHGASYSAGEIGYLVVDWEDGKPVQFDQFASGPAIEKAYQHHSGTDERIPLTVITERAYADDDIAKQVIQFKAAQFGAILGGFVTSINPHLVVIGGGVPQIGDLWWDAMERAFHAAVPLPVQQTPCVPSSLGIEAVMLGAAMFAWERSKA